MKVCEGVRVGSEPQLPGPEQTTVAAAELVVHGQKRQADPRAFGRGGDAGGHLGGVVVGRPSGWWWR